jgi:two-component system nitrate/nitrite response regulator NarL
MSPTEPADGGLWERPRVLVVDDHAVLADALKVVLAHEQMDVEIARDLTVDGVVSAAERFGAEVAILDLYLSPDHTCIGMIAPLCQRGVRVLVLTASEKAEDLAACYERGAVGVLPKNEALGASVDAVRAAIRGEAVRAAERSTILLAAREDRNREAARLAPFERLTPTEQVVLGRLMDGRTAEEIAAEQVVSLNTVRSHIRSVLVKLGVNSQLAAVVMAQQAGWRPR